MATPADLLRQAELEAWEKRLRTRELALGCLEEAMQNLKLELASKEAEVAGRSEISVSPKRRRGRRSRRAMLVSLSPRKRSPMKARRMRLSNASTTASYCTASSASPERRRSGHARRSSAVAVEEPPPCPAGDCLLTSYPLVLGTTAWDWPLSREEKKALVVMFDRCELMLQRDELATALGVQCPSSAGCASDGET
mmetsp:Transcript_78562/g.139379  ORF Transcript_78562/g.139379 Transcript_78562/m.139379 type:complete len:196 (-) Transcript_78562:82-669(-)